MNNSASGPKALTLLLSGGMLVLFLFLSPPARAAPPPQSPLPVAVALVEEGLDSQGRWQQRFRITIKPGGTLSHASLALFGEATRTDELFRAAQRANPQLTNPARVPVGQQFEITVDPAVTFVPKESAWDAAQEAQQQLFYNGVRETVYPKAGAGLLRVVEFPADKPAPSFRYAIDGETVVAPAGTKLVLYRYQAGDDFLGLVQKLYGVASVKAMQDFITQTRWDPNRWPPPPGEVRRLLISTRHSYEDARPAPLTLTSPDPQASPRLRELSEARARAGVFPVAQSGTGLTYQVMVANPQVSAKEVARLIYGGEDKYLEVARRAGIAVPIPDRPPDFDPILLGRSFELSVDYAEERFLLGAPGYDPQAAKGITHLLNGTVIEDYERAAKGAEGVHQIVFYPTGYQRLRYRPSETALFLLDFLHFQWASLASPQQDEKEREPQARQFTAQTLWRFASGLPRDPQATPEKLALIDTSEGPLLEVVIRPREPARQGLLQQWTQQPFFLAAALTFLAGVALVLRGLPGQSFPSPSRRQPRHLRR